MRRVIGLLVIAAVGVRAIAVLFARRQATLRSQANAERWYRIEQNGRHIGFMHNTHAEQTLTTHINYRAPEAPPVVIHQRLQFADQPPFSLQARSLQSAHWRSIQCGICAQDRRWPQRHLQRHHFAQQQR